MVEVTVQDYAELSLSGPYAELLLAAAQEEAVGGGPVPLDAVGTEAEEEALARAVEGLREPELVGGEGPEGVGVPVLNHQKTGAVERLHFPRKKKVHMIILAKLTLVPCNCLMRDENNNKATEYEPTDP